jgi:hypothetical protein
VALVDLKAYLTATKTGGLRQDISIHLWFDYDITCFRFVIRVGGTPWFKAPITTKSGSQRSPYVLLGGDGVTGRETQGSRFENAQERQQAQLEGGGAAAGEHPTVTAARRSNERAEQATSERERQRREGR